MKNGHALVWRAGIAGALVMLAPISAAHSQAALDTILPEPTGPHGVGRIFEDWTDENRVDPLAPAPDTLRRLPVTIWYPAQQKGDGATPYFPNPLRDAFPADLSPVRTHAVDGAPAAAGEERYPVLLLKAAFGFLTLQHSALAEDLASHGYIVVGSDSPHTAPLVIYQDGSTAERTNIGAARDADSAPNELAPGQPNGAALLPLQIWVEDNGFVLDRLETMNAGDGPLAGRMDLTSVGAFGHSYGGATALEFCRADSRCDAAVNIDGFVLGEAVRGGLSAPSLFLFSDRPVFRLDTQEAHDEAARALLAAIDRIQASLPNRPNQAVIEGSAHFNFTDAALYLDTAAARQTGGIGPIDPALATRIANELVRAFFDAHLKGGAAASIEDVAAVHPEVLLE